MLRELKCIIYFLPYIASINTDVSVNKCFFNKKKMKNSHW